MQQYHPIGHPKDEVHVVGDHQHGDLGAQRPDAGGDVGALDGRQTAAGFVQQQEFGVAGQTEGDLQLALLPVGERTHHLVPQVPDPGRFEQFLGGRLQLFDLHEIAEDAVAPLLHALQSDEGVDVYGLLGEQAGDLERPGHAHMSAAIHRHARDVLALEMHRAFGGLELAGENVEQSGLAGAVGADQSQTLPRLDAEGHVA